jgi:hypothetical protein
MAMIKRGYAEISEVRPQGGWDKESREAAYDASLQQETEIPSDATDLDKE